MYKLIHNFVKIVSEYRHAICTLCLGIRDGLRIDQICIVLKNSPNIRNIILKCMILNGFIFLLSNIIWTCALNNIIKYILYTNSDNYNVIYQSFVYMVYNLFMSSYHVNIFHYMFMVLYYYKYNCI